MKKGFTLIELLAVIIILAIIALIATPVVLSAINDAKKSAINSSLSGFADAVKLKITTDYFNNGGVYSTNLDLTTVEANNNSVKCEGVYYTNNTEVLLDDCTVNNEGTYWYINGNVTEVKPDNFETLKADSLVSSMVVETIGVANAPELYAGLIPVKYDGANWIVANTSQSWYNYDNKEWANAITVKETVRSTYTAGKQVVDTDVLTYLVWIPRYEYYIEGIYAGGTQINPGAIRINFTNSDMATTNYTIHPAFNFGGKKEAGIWIGKFETGYSEATSKATAQVNASYTPENSKIIVKPNSYSWTNVDIVKVFYNSLNMNGTNNPYGLTSTSNTHAMKNTEWGAATYLAQSNYGRCTSGVCTEVGINNNSNYITGCGAVAGSGSTTTCNQYNSTDGLLASTTGNIYGIYDMNGGTYEYVLANMKDSNGNFSQGCVEFSTIPDSKYYDSYAYEANSGETYSRSLIGDAIKEMNPSGGNSWYSDICYVQNGMEPWLYRGGSYDEEAMGGLYYTYFQCGYQSLYTSFRITLVGN